MSLTVLTINCFGLVFYVSWRRLVALARELNRLDATVVCIQEVQQHAYRRLLVRAAAAYPFHAYDPYPHAPRGGLLTLSRIPIERQTYTRYRDRGSWFGLSLADRSLSKGILETHHCVGGRRVIVLNTHMNANYGGDWRRESPVAQVEHGQVLQLAEVVAAQPREALVVAAGDFNFPRDSWLYDELIAQGDLADPLSDDPRPTYRPFGLIPAVYARTLDFALFRPPPWPGFRASADLKLEERVALPGGGRAYLSDHVGVLLRAEWEGGQESAAQG